MVPCHISSDGESQNHPAILRSKVMPEKLQKTEAEWRAELTPEEYHIMREKGTERAFTGEYNKEKRSGVYKCRACGQDLFSSETKFDSGTGWPSFYKPLSGGAAEEHSDVAHGQRRTEVVFSRCEGGLGDGFSEGREG